jgi:hypothetical protein
MILNELTSAFVELTVEVGQFWQAGCHTGGLESCDMHLCLSPLVIRISIESLLASHNLTLLQTLCTIASDSNHRDF